MLRGVQVRVLLGAQKKIVNIPNRDVNDFCFISWVHSLHKEEADTEYGDDGTDDFARSELLAVEIP